jgi:hypothetical protein
VKARSWYFSVEEGKPTLWRGDADHEGDAEESGWLSKLRAILRRSSHVLGYDVLRILKKSKKEKTHVLKNVKVKVSAGDILSPKWLCVMHDLSGWTLDQLGQQSRVNAALLCRYKAGAKVLGPEQQRRVLRALRKRIQKRAAACEAVLAEEQTGSPRSSSLAGV